MSFTEFTYQLIQGYDFIIYIRIQLPVANGVQTNGEYYYWY
jgi:tyrosyl-tRNA synthetase